jgi:hypothetical protein
MVSNPNPELPWPPGRLSKAIGMLLRPALVAHCRGMGSVEVVVMVDVVTWTGVSYYYEGRSR